MHMINEHQAPPIPNDEPAVWPAVIGNLLANTPQGTLALSVATDMADRDQMGFERYGTHLQPYNGRDNLLDAYQELLDASVYLKAHLLEEHDSEVARAYQSVLGLIITIKAAMVRREQA